MIKVRCVHCLWSKHQLSINYHSPKNTVRWHFPQTPPGCAILWILEAEDIPMKSHRVGENSPKMFPKVETPPAMNNIFHQLPPIYSTIFLRNSDFPWEQTNWLSSWADFEQISVANPGEMIAEMCQASILSYELHRVTIRYSPYMEARNWIDHNRS